MGVGFVLGHCLGHYLGLDLGFGLGSGLGFHLLPDHLNWPSFMITLVFIFFVLLHIILFISSSYVLLIKYLPPFSSIMININNFCSLKCLFYFKYHIYFIWDSSTIMRIPDKPLCYVRQYGGKSCLHLAIYYYMPCILLISVFHAFIYVPFFCII